MEDFKNGGYIFTILQVSIVVLQHLLELAEIRFLSFKTKQ